MIIHQGTLQLHSGDTLLECVQEITREIGQEILLERGFEDHHTLADKIAEDNGYLGIEDPEIMNLCTVDTESGTPHTLALPDWMDPFLTEYYDSTALTASCMCTYRE